jgi:SAM-dependent methyltransferase
MARVFPEARVTGVDLEADRVGSCSRFARKAGIDNVSFEAGNLLDLGHEDRFDLVLSVDVLEHIEDDRQVLANVAKALKPGGLFVMTTPYWSGDGGRAAPEDFVVGEHVRPGYGEGDLREKMKAAGLELESFRITYGPWGNRAWVLLQKNPISWLSKGFWSAPAVATYLLAAYPIAWAFMQLDMVTANRDGTGLIAVARKASAGPKRSADVS